MPGMAKWWFDKIVLDASKCGVLKTERFLYRVLGKDDDL